MFCNRGLYHEGWTAVTRHSTPWVTVAQLPSFADDVWELYGPDDWTQSQNIAAENPDMLAHLQQLWLIEATKYHVLPLDDRRAERFNPDLAGRPTLIQGTSEILFGGMGRLSENTVLNVKNKSHAVTAEVVVPEDGAAGVIVAQGGAFGGWSLYAKDGAPTYCYNFFGLEQTHIAGSTLDRGGSSGRCPIRSRRTRPATSARMSARPSPPTTVPRATPSPAPSPGCRSISAPTTTTT
jgi:arylsulfatase